jgi:hypothetical protein
MLIGKIFGINQKDSESLKTAWGCVAILHGLLLAKEVSRRGGGEEEGGERRRERGGREERRRDKEGNSLKTAWSGLRSCMDCCWSRRRGERRSEGGERRGGRW